MLTVPTVAAVLMVLMVVAAMVVATLLKHAMLMPAAKPHRMVLRFRVAVEERVLLEIICCSV
jgi:hypothetical protein